MLGRQDRRRRSAPPPRRLVPIWPPLRLPPARTGNELPPGRPKARACGTAPPRYRRCRQSPVDPACQNATGIAHPDLLLGPPSLSKATASLGVTKATVTKARAATTGVNLHEALVCCTARRSRHAPRPRAAHPWLGRRFRGPPMARTVGPFRPGAIGHVVLARRSRHDRAQLPACSRRQFRGPRSGQARPAEPDRWREISTTTDGFHIEATVTGEDARELNRSLLSALRRAERRTRLRSEWTAGGTTHRFFDYASKGSRPSTLPGKQKP